MAVEQNHWWTAEEMQNCDRESIYCVEDSFNPNYRERVAPSALPLERLHPTIGVSTARQLCAPAILCVPYPRPGEDTAVAAMLAERLAGVQHPFREFFAWLRAKYPLGVRVARTVVNRRGGVFFRVYRCSACWRQIASLMVREYNVTVHVGTHWCQE